MPVKIRLQRHGRKGYAFYHVVIADSRAPRDGRFIERVGSYNPNTDPATVQINFDRALYWVQTGAQPTDTVRNLLSAAGVYMKKHLLGGVVKGAFDEAEAERRFAAWKSAKDAAVEKVKQNLSIAVAADLKKRVDAEKATNKAKTEAIAKKKADELAATIEAANKVAAEEAAAAAAEEAAEKEAKITEAEEIAVEAAETETETKEVAEVAEETTADSPAEEIKEEKDDV